MCYVDASKLLLTGELHPPSSPILKELFHTIVSSPTELMPAALSLARKSSRENSAQSVALIKSQLWRPPAPNRTQSGIADALQAAHEMESQALAWTVVKGDAGEGVTSFREKRAPKFQKADFTQMEQARFYPWWTQSPLTGGSNASAKAKL